MKKTPRRTWILIATGVILLFTGGCYRSPAIDFYEPHVYKGSDDPLVSKLGDRQLQEQLDERFRSVQTDR